MNRLLILLSLLAVVFCGCKKDTEEVSYNATKVKTITVGDTKFDMVLVKASSFVMGATTEQMRYAQQGEYPSHHVTMPNFYIAKTEVTQGLWNAVMGENNSLTQSLQWTDTLGLGNDFPVYNVSSDDCQEFISKLNELTGLNFHLPTEAEWEYAARGGKNSNNYLFSGTNDASSVAWFVENSNFTCHQVATLDTNELGLYDMSGNVEEWCHDWYDAYSYDSQYDPWGPLTGWPRVIRGGAWNSASNYLRVSCRNYNYPDQRKSSYGFRLVLDY